MVDQSFTPWFFVPLHMTMFLQLKRCVPPLFQFSIRSVGMQSYWNRLELSSSVFSSACRFEEVVSGALISVGLFDEEQLVAMMVAETKTILHCNPEVSYQHRDICTFSSDVFIYAEIQNLHDSLLNWHLLCALFCSAVVVMCHRALNQICIQLLVGG